MKPQNYILFDSPKFHNQVNFHLGIRQSLETFQKSFLVKYRVNSDELS